MLERLFFLEAGFRVSMKVLTPACQLRVKIMFRQRLFPGPPC